MGKVKKKTDATHRKTNMHGNKTQILIQTDKTDKTETNQKKRITQTHTHTKRFQTDRQCGEVTIRRVTPLPSPCSSRKGKPWKRHALLLRGSDLRPCQPTRDARYADNRLQHEPSLIESLVLVFLNTLLSHHKKFPRSQRPLAGFSRQFLLIID